jgi:hypothetical protein
VLAAVLAITGLAVTIRESVLFDTGNLEAGLAHLAAGLFATNGAALGVGALMLAAAAALSLEAGPLGVIGSERR